MKQFNTSIYLDKRRARTNGLFIVKLRVYSVLTKKEKLYPIGKDLSIDDYDQIFSHSKIVRGKNREVEIFVSEFQNKAEKVASEIRQFTFTEFEQKFLRNKNAHISVKYHYDTKIKELTKNEQIGTAETYITALKSFTTYLNKKTRIKIENLTFFEVNAKFLNDYECYMIKELERSYNTVSVYVRTLRKIFSDAIDEGDIKGDLLPFGKGSKSYQIPRKNNNKIALTKVQISALFKSKPKTVEQEKAKAFWFFMYFCFGMNVKDIALLRFEKIDRDILRFNRAKTINTKKGNLREIEVDLNDFTRDVIENYGNLNKSPKQLIFPIVDESNSAKQQHHQVKNFTRFINQNINQLAKSIELNVKISSNIARHTFATISVNKGAKVAEISKLLGHGSVKVTEGYLSSIETDTRKRIANNLMEF